MSTDLLPTPTKSHYIFNLRDLSKCIQGNDYYVTVAVSLIWSHDITGVLQADPGIIREHVQVYRLFCHECQRVFHDRLIDKTDKDYFNGILSEMSLKHFSKVSSHTLPALYVMMICRMFQLRSLKVTLSSLGTL